jgi:hypothetical protein
VIKVALWSLSVGYISIKLRVCVYYRWGVEWFLEKHLYVCMLFLLNGNHHVQYM